MHGAAFNISPLVVKLLAESGADPQIWKNPNKAGGTPLYIAEGYTSRLPRPDAPTIVEETRQYIRDFDRIAANTQTANELYDRMLAIYPDRVNPAVLWNSARAVKA